MSETNAERIANTVAWYPETFKISQSSSHEAALAAVYDIIQTLLRPRPASPLSLIADSMQSSLLELTKIFQNSVYRTSNQFGGKQR